MMNIPIEPSRKVVNGEVEEEHVAMAWSLGFNWTAYRFQAFKKATLEPQLGFLAGSTFNSAEANIFFPLPFFRMHLVSENGFTMYFGSGLVFRKETFFLIYGIGHKF